MNKTLLFSLLFIWYAQAQNNNDLFDLDTLYKEDQFVAKFSYVLPQINNKQIDTQGLPFSWSFSYYLDLPLNKKRNFAIAIGLGYQYKQLQLGAQLVKHDNASLLFTYDNTVFNRLKMHQLTIPIALRFRTSTPELKPFWRFYPYFKIHRNLRSSFALYNGAGEHLSDTDLLKDWEGSAGISFGYGAWNLNVDYTLFTGFNSNIEMEGDANTNLNFLSFGFAFFFL